MSPKFTAGVELRGIDKVTPMFAKASTGLERFGKSVGRVGRKISTGLTLPTIAMGAGIFRATANFSRGMNRVKALTGATTRQMSAMSDQALELGQSTVFSASEAAQAQGLLAQAGFKTTQVMTAMPAVLDLASAGQLDLGEATSIAADTLKGYGFEAASMGRVADVLAKSSLLVNVEVREMGEAFKMAGGVANAAGQAFETSTAVLAGLAEVGSKATMGGTAYRQMLLSLINTTPKARMALSELGLAKSDLFNDDGSLKDFIDIVAAFERVGAGSNVEALAKIFDSRNAGPMAALINAGAAKLEGLRGEALNSDGEAARIAKIQMEGAAGAYARLSAAFEKLAITIGNSGIVDRMVSVMEHIGKFANWLGSLNPKLLELGFLAIASAAAFGPLLIGMGSASQVLGSLVSGYGFLAPTLNKLAGVILARLTPAFASLSAAMMANPIGFTIVAISGLILAGYMLWKHWDQIAEWIADAFLELPTIFWGVFDAIFAGYDWLFRKLPEGLQELLGIIEVPDGLKELADLWSLIGDGGGNTQHDIDVKETAAAALPGLNAANAQAKLEVDIRAGNLDARARVKSSENTDLTIFQQGVALAAVTG